MKISSVGEDAEYTVNSHCRQRHGMKMGILEECEERNWLIRFRTMPGNESLFFQLRFSILRMHGMKKTN
jgi:hypothetical protein